MKTMIKTTIYALVLLILMGFTTKKQSSVSLSDCKKNNDHVVLVLMNPMEKECFSVFKVVKVGDVLVGVNQDEYPVRDGLYRIEGSSNDDFYHKKIIIIEG